MRCTLEQFKQDEVFFVCPNVGTAAIVELAKNRVQLISKREIKTYAGSFSDLESFKDMFMPKIYCACKDERLSDLVSPQDGRQHKRLSRDLQILRGSRNSTSVQGRVGVPSLLRVGGCVIGGFVFECTKLKLPSV